MNKITNIILILSMIIFGATSCRQQATPVEAELLSAAGADATAPYMTKDNDGNPVICWAEKSSKDSLFQLKYSVFSADDNKFGLPWVREENGHSEVCYAIVKMLR